MKASGVSTTSSQTRTRASVLSGRSASLLPMKRPSARHWAALRSTSSPARLSWQVTPCARSRLTSPTRSMASWTSSPVPPACPRTTPLGRRSRITTQTATAPTRVSKKPCAKIQPLSRRMSQGCSRAGLPSSPKPPEPLGAWARSQPCRTPRARPRGSRERLRRSTHSSLRRTLPQPARVSRAALPRTSVSRFRPSYSVSRLPTSSKP